MAWINISDKPEWKVIDEFTHLRWVYDKKPVGDNIREQIIQSCFEHGKDFEYLDETVLEMDEHTKYLTTSFLLNYYKRL